MRILNTRALDRFSRRHRDAATWLAAWTRVVSDAEWQSLMDARKDYPSADGVTVKSGAVVTVFNVKGNEYRLLTRISYAAQDVLVIDVLTHDEYDRDAW